MRGRSLFGVDVARARSRTKTPKISFCARRLSFASLSVSWIFAMELFFLCLLRRRSVLNAFLNLLLLFLQNDPVNLNPTGRKEGESV